jgi:hypothetical protein
MIESRCGIKCNECKWVPKTNCPGCIAAHGRPFHGECPVAICCENRNLQHCGQCANFPCQQLTEYAYDKEHGDNGTRIETLKQWLE